jgi:hypothetical protein
MNDRQAPAYVAQRKRIAMMSWDECLMEYSKKGLCPNYEAMLEVRLDEHQAQFDASRLGNSWNYCGIN